jgi:hypothetical protein
MMESRVHGLDDAYNHFSMQCRNLRFRITMKQCRCKLKKITCAPIIFLPMQIKRRAEKISPAKLKGEESISAEISSATRHRRR